MIDSIINLTQNLLWKDSPAYLFIISVLEDNEYYIVKIFLLLLTIIFNLTIIKYLFYSKAKNATKSIWRMWEYLRNNIIKLIWLFFLYNLLFIIFIISWLYLDIFSWIVNILGIDNRYNPWFAFLYWWDSESIMYKYYSIGSFIVIITWILYNMYLFYMYSTVWVIQKAQGTVDYKKKFLHTLSWILISIILLFTTLPSEIFYWIFWDESLNNLI